MEILQLLVTGIGNFFYVLFLDSIDAFYLWRYPLLCYINFKLWLAFLFRPPYVIINREYPGSRAQRENFIYGETPHFTLKALLQAAGAKPGDHFFDLGCGRGKTVFAAWYFFRLPATGIELLRGLVYPADRLRLKLKCSQVSFIQGDINAVDLSAGTVFLINGTTWSGEVLSRLGDKLALLAHEARFISLSQPLPGFPVESSGYFWFSWGKVQVYFQGNRVRP